MDFDFEFPGGDNAATAAPVNAVGGEATNKVWEIKLHSYDGGGPAYEVICEPEGIVRHEFYMSAGREENGMPLPGAARWHTYRFYPVKPGIADVVIYTWFDRGAHEKKRKRIYSRFKLVVADDMTIKAVQDSTENTKTIRGKEQRNGRRQERRKESRGKSKA